METYVLALLIGFISQMDSPTLSFMSYSAGVEFQSPQVYELIGSSYICSKLDFTQEYGWISNLAGKFVRKRA